MKLKPAILTLVFVLSVGFFWLAINEYLIQSRAQLAGDFQVVPHAREITCNPKGECYLHILGSTATTNAIAGVTGHVTYSEALQPVRADSIGICRTSTYGLDMGLQFKDDPASRTVTFSVGALKEDALLKGGNGCITTLVFKPVNVQSNPQIAELTLSKRGEWKAGGLKDGQRTIFTPQIETEKITVTIDISAPIEGGGTGGGGGDTNPGSCGRRGDCTCDDTVDLVDWEILRSSIQKEGATCDLTGDGKSDAMDISVLIQENELFNPSILHIPGGTL